MTRRNLIMQAINKTARKFRVWQEVWILPYLGKGGLMVVPLWALDSFVLVLKLCSTCTMAVVKVLIPPVMKSLHGETILITCTGHGVGRELAIQLAELGANVICWDSDPRRTRAIVEQIRKRDGECVGYTVDVTVREQVTAVATKMRRQSTEVSMVISNSGTLTCAPLVQLRPDSVAKVVEDNLTAHLYTIQAFLPSMIERRCGHIVAINSSAGLVPFADMVPYCAAKYGLRGMNPSDHYTIGLMDSLAEELRLDTWTKNIQTTTVYLSSLTTGMYPPATHRFAAWFSEITPKEAARIIIEGIRKNNKCISIPSIMKYLIELNNFLPYRIRIIFMDFFNFGHRTWFSFC